MLLSIISLVLSGISIILVFFMALTEYDLIDKVEKLERKFDKFTGNTLYKVERRN